MLSVEVAGGLTAQTTLAGWRVWGRGPWTRVLSLPGRWDQGLGWEGGAGTFSPLHPPTEPLPVTQIS